MAKSNDKPASLADDKPKVELPIAGTEPPLSEAQERATVAAAMGGGDTMPAPELDTSGLGLPPVAMPAPHELADAAREAAGESFAATLAAAIGAPPAVAPGVTEARLVGFDTMPAPPALPAAYVVSSTFDGIVHAMNAAHGELAGGIAAAEAAAGNVRDLAHAKDVLGNVVGLLGNLHGLMAHMQVAVQTLGVELRAARGGSA